MRRVRRVRNTKMIESQEDYDMITGLYTRWNLPPERVKKLDTWALWQPTKEELSLHVYKVRKCVNTPEFVINHFERHLLYKGSLYHIVWQNDSAEYFFTPKGKRDERFVISIRAKDDVKVALVQRRWN